MATIGFVGLGQMGRPMSRNLLKAGHGVAVFDIDRAAVEAMARDSARAAESPADAAEGADFVITMLPTGPIVSEAVFGNGGIAESLAPEALYGSRRGARGLGRGTRLYTGRAGASAHHLARQGPQGRPDPRLQARPGAQGHGPGAGDGGTA